MTVRRRRSDRSGRSKLHSPGRPDSARREELVRFWAAIATGRSSEDAADAGVSPPVGSRWFRRSGGMPPSHLSQSAKPLSGRYLSFEEREEIALLRAQGRGIRHIACRLERAPSTILLLQEFPHQPNCRPSVPAGLNQEIQDFALTVHRHARDRTASLELRRPSRPGASVRSVE